MNYIILYNQINEKLNKKKNRIEQKLLKQHKDGEIRIIGCYLVVVTSPYNNDDTCEGIKYEYEYKKFS
jgi:peroxiredoxin family protein